MHPRANNGSNMANGRVGSSFQPFQRNPQQHPQQQQYQSFPQRNFQQQQYPQQRQTYQQSQTQPQYMVQSRNHQIHSEPVVHVAPEENHIEPEEKILTEDVGSRYVIWQNVSMSIEHRIADVCLYVTLFGVFDVLPNVFLALYFWVAWL